MIETNLNLASSLKKGANAQKLDFSFSSFLKDKQQSKNIFKSAYDLQERVIKRNKEVCKTYESFGLAGVAVVYDLLLRQVEVVTLSMHYLFVLICMCSEVEPGFCNLYSLPLSNITTLAER